MNSNNFLRNKGKEDGGVDTEESNAGERLPDEQAAPPSSSLRDLAELITANLYGADLIGASTEEVTAFGVIFRTLRSWKW